MLNVKMLTLHLADQEELKKVEEVRNGICLSNSCSFPNAGIFKLHQRNPKCTVYHSGSTNFRTGNTGYVQVFK